MQPHHQGPVDQLDMYKGISICVGSDILTLNLQGKKQKSCTNTVYSALLCTVIHSVSATAAKLNQLKLKLK
jgi:hypothetical protein